MPIRVLIADDHGIVAEGLRHLLSAQDDIEVVGLAENGRDAVRFAIAARPDIVLMDHAMPLLNGTEAAQVIHSRCEQTRVIMLSMHSDMVHVYRALHAGAAGYILKKSVAKEVVDAIRSVHLGGRYLSKQLADEVINHIADRDATDDPLEQLSSRERQVLQLLVEGHSNVEAGAMLSLSPKTIETYRARVMSKLGIFELSGLVRFAIQHGITSLE